MKIKNNKIVFEVVTCWDCSGRKQVLRGIHCKNYRKNQRGRPCEYCGSKNKHDHKIVDRIMIECYTCKGTGSRLENKFDNISKSLIEPIISLTTFTFKSPDMQKIDPDARFIATMYTGVNSFSGSQDYNDHRKSSPELILEKVLKQVREGYTHQVLNYIDSENNLKLNIHYWGYYGGYTAQWADGVK